MARETEFKRAGSSFGNTIRQSIDMITGHNINNYTLVFIDPTKNYKKGDSKNIVVPYIVLGRSASCDVQYGDEYPTVSRQHASIQSDEKGFTLIHNPEAKNPTYVDGHPVEGFQRLESGDEIQLSNDGPRLRFISDQLQKTSTLGFTRRISMAMGQGLRPYRTGLYIIGGLLICAIGYSFWSSIQLSQFNKQQAALQEEIELSNQKIHVQDSTLGELKDNGEGAYTEALKALEKDIYFIKVTDIKFTQSDPYNRLEPSQKTWDLATRWSGTGFLTSDGKFITARHVVEPWIFPDEECSFESVLNNFILDGGSVLVKFKATSSNGDSINFTNKDLRTDKTKDEFYSVSCNFQTRENFKMRITKPGTSSTDWAYFDLGGRNSNITYDRELSKNLLKGEALYVIGYPMGERLQKDNSANALDPLFSKVTVGQNGIINGLLNVTENSFIGGNSGGPVFAKRGSKYIVIGIISSTNDKIGRIVPIANIW